MQFVLYIITSIGHIFLWIGIVNRVHARNVPRPFLRVLTVTCYAIMGFIPLAGGWWWFTGGNNVVGQIDRQIAVQSGWLGFFLYVLFCWLAAAATLVRWICYRCLRRPPELLRFHHRRPVAITPAAAALTAEEHAHHISVHLPGNEVLRLDLAERAFEVPRLPKALDGLTIVHMSDLHFNGKVGKAYFREVVRISNELKPDLVAITGDLVDKSEYLSWIPDTLGQLTGRYGVYVILGNHDTSVDEIRLRRTLIDTGLTDVGGRWISVEVRGAPIIIAGNELPWFPPAADLENCPPRDKQSGGTGRRGGTGMLPMVLQDSTGETPVAPGTQQGQLRIVLSHSPDQLDWARDNDVDLMLSGHTHGGQIRIPLIGPILSPTASGVKYNEGLFHVPPTMLHVTRGVSGEHPLRWNCPPEIALLTLHIHQ